MIDIDSVYATPAVSPFVGRQGEWAELHAALDNLGAGRGGLVLLAGEPGIGKTRLLDALSAEATGREVRVAWGRCWEAGGAPAYFPLSQALRSLWRTLDEDERRHLAQADATPVGLLIPELASIAAPPSVPPEDPAKARFDLFEAVAGVLRRASQARPILLALDDLHGADRSSLALLAYIARELRTMAVLILGTFRDVEARLSPEIGADLARISREGKLLALPRLDRKESAEMAAGLGVPQDPGVVDALYRATQGNPLFIAEMLRGFRPGGDVARFDRATGELPHGVRELVRQRLGWLSPEAREALEVAAVMGDEFVPGHVAVVLERDVASVETALASACAANVIVERADRRLRFGHSLFRESLYRDLPWSRRQRLHAAVLVALERRFAGHAGAPTATFAHHALEGGPALVARAVAYAARAAEAALDVAAYEEAISVTERALAVASDQSGDPRVRAEATLALGICHLRAGDGQLGKDACRQVAELAASIDDADLHARAALAYGMEILVGVVDPVLVHLLEQSLARLPPGDSALRARLKARLAGALQPCVDPARPIALAQEAIASARRLDDEATLLGVLYAGMSAMMDYVEPTERVPLNREIEVLATRLNDQSKRLRANARLFIDFVELPDLVAAASHVETYGRLAEQTQLAHHKWRTPLMRAMLRVIEGRFAEADGLAAEAAALAEGARNPEAARTVATYRLFSRFMVLDGLERGAEAFAPLWADLPGGSDLASTFAAVTAAYVEDVEATRFHLQRLHPSSLVWAGDPSLLAWLSEAVSFAGDKKSAKSILDRLEPVGDRCLSTGMAAYGWLGPASRFRGLLLASLERWDEAEVNFADAHARLARLGARPYLARVGYEWARALMYRGRVEDVPRAVELLESTIAEAEALGMVGLRVAAGRRRAALVGEPAPLLGPHGGGVPARAAASASASGALSLRCEGEYWTLQWGDGSPVRLKDSRGIRLLARLVAAPGEDVHVLELAAPPAGSGNELTDGGDAGDCLDEEARRAYRTRMQDLRESIAEAEGFSDNGRLEAARAELELLSIELSRAVGLGGRVRRVGSASERARVAVQRRIRDAISRVQDVAPPLGEHLARAVYTGLLCSYRPAEPRRSRQ
jgi:AAA ATPase domain